MPGGKDLGDWLQEHTLILLKSNDIGDCWWQAHWRFIAKLPIGLDLSQTTHVSYWLLSLGTGMQSKSQVLHLRNWP